ncbi:3-oxoacyl-ACP synthase III family protein [Streptomyces rishiriensis]|uniref:3-oxoacyl-ACP synthase III family protein n=1 Tax=Streptomyces rishiriensis TaxID=68264 RepID=UPI0037D42F64
MRSVAVHVPERRQTAQEIEDEITARNPRLRLMRGTLRQMYGFEERRVAPDGTLPSELAVAAAAQVLDQAGLAADAVDLLLFASTGEDLEEPATAHVVAHALGVTAPVFDVKNACNGVLNALETADALIRTGRYRRVLITTGERGSMISTLPVRDRSELAMFLPALTLSDLGAAVLLEASDRPGLIGGRFYANSSGWRAMTLTKPHFTPHTGEVTVRFDFGSLAESFIGMAPAALDVLHDLGVKPDDLALVAMHQASVPFTRTILGALGIPEHKIVPTFSSYGNAATVSLPLQLVLAEQEGRLHPGDLVALLGLASGASAGVMLMEWHPCPTTGSRTAPTR